MPSLIPPKKYYPFLDGFRTFAVLWVILHHLCFFFDMNYFFIQAYTFLHNFFRIDPTNFLLSTKKIFYQISIAGTLGVDMFFVISGFLITGLLIDTKGQKEKIKRFYIRRIFKIIPQYFLALTAALILFSLIKPTLIIGGLRDQPTFAVDTVPLSYFFFLQNYFPSIPFLAHTWSLVIEEQFYLFYPLILYFIFKIKQNDKDQQTLLIITSFVFIAVSHIVRIYYFNYGKPLLNFPLLAPVTFTTTLFRSDALAFGCLLRILEPYYASKSKHDPLIGLTCFGCGFTIYLFFIFGPISVGDFRHDHWYTYTLAYIAPGALLVAAYKGYSFLVELNSIRWIGRNSYGIYLWHYILIFPFGLLAEKWNILLIVFLYVLSTLLVGIITTQTIERSFLQIRSKIAP